MTATALPLEALPFAHEPETAPRLLLATDGSPESVAARVAAVDLARRLHAELHIVHAWLCAPVDEEDAERAARRLLFREQLDAVNQGGCVHATHLVEGDAASVVVERAATLGTDLVVMGGRRLDGFDRWLLGSVSDPVARLARCAVLVVRAGSRAWPPQRVTVGPHTCDDGLRAAADVARLLDAELDLRAQPRIDTDAAAAAAARTLTVLARRNGRLMVDVLVARRLHAAPGPVLVLSPPWGSAARIAAQRGRRALLST